MKESNFDLLASSTQAMPLVLTGVPEQPENSSTHTTNANEIFILFLLNTALLT